MQQLPHRFREDQFRRYEPYIAQIVKAFPRPVSFKMNELASTTFSSRLRDSIKSLEQHGWKTDWPYLPAILAAITVADRGNLVVGGDAAHIRLMSQAGLLAEATSEPTVVSTQELTVQLLSEADAVLMLANNGVLKLPLTLKCPESWTSALSTDLYANIFVRETEPNTFLIV
jgi:hypothetical protein